MVTLKEEMEHVQNYLSIQKMRLGNRLNYLVEVDEMAEDILCPFMTIQPFVENAIIHAIEPNARGGEVKITADIMKEIAILKIVWRKNPLFVFSRLFKNKDDVYNNISGITWLKKT